MVVAVSCDNRQLRLSAGFVLIPMEDGILIDGGRTLKVLKGILAVSLCPVIISLIDGSRDVAGISALLPTVPAAHVETLIKELVALGVIVVGATPQGSDSESVKDTLSVLSRWDPGLNWNAARNILAHQRVVLLTDCCPEVIAEAVAKAMISNGFERIQIMNTGQIERNASNQSDDVFLSICVDQGRDRLNEHYLTMSSLRQPWLRSIISSRLKLAEIGPLFRPDTVLCVSCLESFDSTFEETTITAVDLVWPGLLATEVSARLLGPIPPGPRSFRRYRLPLFESELKTWPLKGACQHCEATSSDPSRPSRNSNTPLPQIYEDEIARREEVGEYADQIFPLNTVSTPLRQMLDSERLSLPQVEVNFSSSALDTMLAGRPSGESMFGIEGAARLLGLCAGFKPGSPGARRRWIPSGGNLSSVEVFLVADSIQGIPRGVYFYHPEQHVLVRLNRRRVDHVDEVYRAIGDEGRSTALLILTSDFSRIARKYASFAYKLIHLDAGVACSQLTLVSRAMNARLQGVSTWDALALGRALGLRTPSEVCTQAFRIGPILPSSDHVVRFTRSDLDSSLIDPEINMASSRRLPDISNGSLVEQLVYDSSHVATRLPNEIKSTRSLASLRLRRYLATGVREEATLGAVLKNRVSVRRFSERAVDGNNVKLILRCALANNVIVDSSLVVRVFMRTVIGFKTGVYLYDPSSERFTRERDLASDPMVRRFFFGSHYEKTPVIFWISAKLCSATLADAGYQTMLVRAGFLAHRLCIAGAGLGLSGVLVGGVTAEVTTRNDELIPPEETSVVAFLCGYPSINAKSDPS